MSRAQFRKVGWGSLSAGIWAGHSTPSPTSPATWFTGDGTIGSLPFPYGMAFSENFVLPLSHDDVVHGKGSLLSRMSGDRSQQHANLRSLLAWTWAHPGRKLLFMGAELVRLENGNMTVNWNGSGLMMMRARAYRIWSRHSTDSTARCQLCGSATPTGGASSGSKWLTKHAISCHFYAIPVVQALRLRV